MNTKQELKRTERARRNLALKLVLEQRFIPEVKRYFNFIVRDFNIIYVVKGQTLNVESYHDDTVLLLKRQYKRVARAFSDEMRLFIEKSLNIQILTKQDEDEKLAELVALALLLFENKASKERAFLLDETTTKDINESTLEAISEIQEEGGDLSNISIATLASSKLKKKFQSRIDTIALTETQFSSERTKAIEAGILSEGENANVTSIVEAVVNDQVETLKQWAAILDNVTRPAHAIADGQTVKMSDPFIVGGELLKYPSDLSMGASTGNTINCRCSALYTL